MVNLSIRNLVIIFISIIGLILGIVLMIKINFVSNDYLLPSSSDNIKIMVNPLSSQKGTVFLIKAYDYSKKESMFLELLVESEDYKGFIKLYDDGEHQDENIGDGIYAGYFDSKDKPLGVYSLYSLNSDNKINFSVYESNCEIIKGKSGDDKINFLILSSGYEDIGEFKEDVIDILEGKDSLLEVEPFKSNKDKFSFLINNFNVDLGCELGCRGIDSMICCDNKKVFEAASNCHFDSLFILFNDNGFCGSASSYAKICSKNEDRKIILLHELGHSFGDLADEYVYEDFYENYNIGEIDLANCDKEDCNKWEDISDECYKGCSYSSLFRSKESKSIMLDLYPEFNKVSINQIQKIIDSHILNEKKVERLLPNSNSYFVNLNYNRGEIKINDIFLKPIKSSVEVRDSGYSLDIMDENNNILFKNNLKIPNKILPINNSNPIFLDEFDFEVLLPYYLNADKLIIYEGEEIVAEKPLRYFSKSFDDDFFKSNKTYKYYEVSENNIVYFLFFILGLILLVFFIFIIIRKFKKE